MRLSGFDYSRPFFYMVTLKGTRSVLCKTPFCTISEEGAVVANAITGAFERVIRSFHETFMPDHLHLILKMRDIEKRVRRPCKTRCANRSFSPPPRAAKKEARDGQATGL